MTKNSGFSNENELIEAINGKIVSDINHSIIKNLISRIYSSPLKSSDLILCKKPDQIDEIAPKPDIEIIINNKSHYISIKKGSGNSVHQEPLEQFVEYLSSNIGISNEKANHIRFFIWGDKTFNNSGRVYDRMGVVEIKKKYPDIINSIQSIFNEHKRELIERFIKQGSGINNPPADYMFYGTEDYGIIRKTDNVIKYLCSVKLKPPSVGALTFQAWNRNINGGYRSERKRGHIQLKWGRIGKELGLVDE